MRGFENINPFVLFMYFTFVSVIPMFLTDGIFYIISLVASIIVYLIFNRSYLKIHLLAFGILVFTPLINAIFSHNGKTVLFILNNSPITFEAFLYGLFLSFFIVSSIYWFTTFSSIMKSDKILYVFDGVSPKFALVISMALRYIPLFKKQIKKHYEAQMFCGGIDENSFVEKRKNDVKIFSSMVTWTIENGIITAESMEARGYGIGKRSRYSNYYFTLFDFVFLVVIILLAVLSFALTRNSVFEYYPTFDISIEKESVFGYFLYGILAFLPAMIEIKEKIKWKLLERKI